MGQLIIKNAQDEELTITHPDNAGAISLSSDNLAPKDSPEFTGGVTVSGGRVLVGQTAGDYAQFGKDTGGNAFVDATQPDAEFGVYINSTSTGYNKKLGVDSAGRVTMPNQPSFCARGCSNYTGSGSWRQMLFDGSVTHNVGNHYNSSTGAFTAPVAGSYSFSFNLFITVGYRYMASFLVNGGDFQEITTEPNGGGSSSNGYVNLNSTITVYLNVGDTFSIRSLSNLLGSSITWSSFSGYLIG
jgi:hypothetical protein